MVLSYLVSTAAHAKEQNEADPHDITSILQLIREGAEELGKEHVVGFTSLKNGTWACDRYSYEDLIALSDQRGRDLQANGVRIVKQGTVSMLCPTGLQFLVTWIALMRMGYGVVLIAPQCSPSAIAHLFKSTSSTRLIYHPKYAELAESTARLDSTLDMVPIHESSSTPCDPTGSGTLPSEVDDIHQASHIFHTSGTSGTPKPIPHTHFHSTSVLPRRAMPQYIRQSSSVPIAESAAFTTTPLFHGGVSDLLRAWMARSMIYFYPTSDSPITASDVAKAVDACNGPLEPHCDLELSDRDRREREERYKLTAFLSVPYILSILAEDETGPGMRMLQSMKLVSTGGAPLDTKTGDRMVEQGVHLVSRLGSSECGFLLSSYRDFESEIDWEWLRNDSRHGDLLVFEKTIEEDKFEMIVSKDWPSKTKTNRDDGSYATGDLYSPHPTKPNVWRYVGRGDDVIVMRNGEKASPGPIETILRRSPLLSDALVVGADQDRLGILLFPKSNIPDLIAQISPLLDEANGISPSFAQISVDMCRNVNRDRKSRSLPKSSKGTVQRGVAYTEFAVEIAALFGDKQDDGASAPKRRKEEIADVVRETIGGVAKGRCKVEKLDAETDLFAWGVDSLMATRIRAGLKKRLHTAGKDLPSNVVFENPSIMRLSEYIFALQEGTSVNGSKNVHDVMRQMVEEYGTFSPLSQKDTSPTRDVTEGKTILLTGATGTLGTYILSELCALPGETIRQVICLVRADSDRKATERIVDSLAERGLNVPENRFRAHAADLSDLFFGLSDEEYRRIRGELDIVIHAAWPVHFASSLVSFTESIRGTRNLIDLVRSTPRRAKFLFCSSVASVLASSEGIVPETPSLDPSTSSPIGYSQSKWVTENICLRASEDGLQDRISILRVGQLCGDRGTGYWNVKEGWPLLFRTANIVNALPVLDEAPSWLPVDLAAGAIIDILLSDKIASVSHIAHPEPIRWSTILDGLQEAGVEFERVDPETWLARLESLDEDDPSRQMLDMWTVAYGGDRESKEKVVETTKARAASRTLRDVEPVGADFVAKMAHAWQKQGFLH